MTYRKQLERAFWSGVGLAVGVGIGVASMVKKPPRCAGCKKPEVLRSTSLCWDCACAEMESYESVDSGVRALRSTDPKRAARNRHPSAE